MSDLEPKSVFSDFLPVLRMDLMDASTASKCVTVKPSLQPLNKLVTSPAIGVSSTSASLSSLSSNPTFNLLPSIINRTYVLLLLELYMLAYPATYIAYPIFTFILSI